MTFDEFARECLEKSQNSIEAAQQLARQRIYSESDVTDAILNDVIEYAIHEKLTECMRSQRATYRPGVARASHVIPRADDPSGLLDVAEVNAVYYGYPLAAGKPLGEATFEHIKHQMEIHQLLAATNGQRARWFERILKKLPNDGKTRVKDVYSEEELAEMDEEAKQG